MIRRRRNRGVRFAESNEAIAKKAADNIYAGTLAIGKEWDEIIKLCNAIMNRGHKIHDAISKISYAEMLLEKIKDN